MTTNTPNDVEHVIGQIKWYDPAKGFGFIIAADGGDDILLHANVLRNFGQGSVADGSGITVVVARTERGLQATQIVEIVPPDGERGPLLRDLDNLSRDQIETAPVEPARVKWFDKGKGFGFANVFGDTRDVFVHIEVLRQSGLSDLQPGEAVGLRLIEGERGRMAVDVVSWDSVLK